MEKERLEELMNKYQRTRNKLDVMWDNSMYFDGPITYHNMITETQNVIYFYTDLLSEYLPAREGFYHKQQLYLSSLCELLKSYVPLIKNADVNDGLEDPLVSTLIIDLSELYYLTCKTMDENIEQGTFKKEISGYPASRSKVINFADKHDISEEFENNEFAEFNKRREFMIAMNELYNNFYKINGYFFEKGCEQFDADQTKEACNAKKRYDDALKRQRKWFDDIINELTNDDIVTLDYLGGLADIISTQMTHFVDFFDQALQENRNRANEPQKIISLQDEKNNANLQ